MLFRHALRNAVISTVTVLGVNIGYLVGGTLVIEQVFALPGLGPLMINSIFERDFPVVQAVTLVVRDHRGARQPAHRRRLRAARPAGAVRHDGVAAEGVHRGADRRAAARLPQPLVPHARVRRRAGHRRHVLAARDLRAAAHPLRPDPAGPPRTPSQAPSEQALAGHRPARPRRLVAAALRRPGRPAGRRSSRCCSRSSSAPCSALLAGYFGGWSTRSSCGSSTWSSPSRSSCWSSRWCSCSGRATRSIYIAITLVGWVSYARIVRGEVLVAEAAGVRAGGPGGGPLDAAHPACATCCPT